MACHLNGEDYKSPRSVANSLRAEWEKYLRGWCKLTNDGNGANPECDLWGVITKIATQLRRKNAAEA